MKDEIRPDTDALLEALKKDERNKHGGKLRIFFGMAAGVGKTYAMLETAQARRNEGVDVVIGMVVTHGRIETELLTRDLAAIPLKEFEYRGTKIREMDIDAILAHHPQLVIIDELAHSNAPGSRHVKRWQDVIEILDAGIDVYTAINVQHIESRIQNVESITGISIHETVPDSILERAAQIDLIDLSPADLLKRLREGKVYLGDMAERAAENFFKEDRLTALREMALRLTAEKVENDLQTLLALRGRVSGWRSSERILVAISHSPTSENLIRTTRRIAFSLDAPWIAVYIDTGYNLSEEDKLQLSKNLALVQQLGGQVISTAGSDIAEVIKRIAHQHGITQIIFGRSTRKWPRDLFSGSTPLDRLVRESGAFDVLVLRNDKPISPRKSRVSRIVPKSGLLSYWYLIWVMAAVSLVNGLLNPIIGYKAVGFIFLLSILIISLFVSLGPILFSAILSAFIWDYFFIPPKGTLTIAQPEDIIMGFTYLLVAIVTGTLTNRIRRREKMLSMREERTNILYEIVRAIAGSPNKEKFIEVATGRIENIFNAKCAVLLKDTSGKFSPVNASIQRWLPTEQEIAVAEYAFHNNSEAGWSTDTLPSAESLYLPLIGTDNTVGVFVFTPLRKANLMPEEMEFLQTVVRQLAIGIEREQLNEQSNEARQLQESERLYQTILDSISHEIRTPLTTIIGSASALQNQQISKNSETRVELSKELTGAAERLNNIVENLLDSSRFSSGMLTLKREWCDFNDVLAISLEKISKIADNHKIQIEIPDDLPLLFVDFRLFEQVLSNLLRNALAISPPGKGIFVEAKSLRGAIEVSIADEGPGIPDHSMNRIFERFYRVPGTPSGGVGLGLWLAKNIVESHSGSMTVVNQPSGGAKFSILLPLEKQPVLPEELEENDGK